MSVCGNTRAFQKAHQKLFFGPVKLGRPTKTVNPLTVSVTVKMRSSWSFCPCITDFL